MGEHSYYAYGNANKKWWEQKTILGLTKNDLVFVTLAIIIAAVFFSLNWDKIVTMW